MLNSLRNKFQIDKVVEPDEIAPTVGQNMSKVETNNIKWTIWDVGGQKRFRNIWDSYYKDIDVLVWVLDSK